MVLSIVILAIQIIITQIIHCLQYFAFYWLAAELLLQKLKTTFAEGAVLLVVRPIRIEGKATAKQFLKFVPSKK